MTTGVRPMKDRRGRCLHAGHRPAAPPLALDHPRRLRPARAPTAFYLASVTALTWLRGTTQQTFFYMLMVCLAPGARIRARSSRSWSSASRTWRPRGSGPTGRPSATAWSLLAAALVILVSGLGPGADRRLRGPRPAGPRRRLLAPRRRARWRRSALYVKHRLAGPRIRWDWARRFGAAGRRLRRCRWGCSTPRTRGRSASRVRGRGSSTSSRPRRSPPTASSSRPRR